MMRAKLGVYIPMYGGWIRTPTLEEEVTYENAERTAQLAEAMGLHSVWVPDHLLNHTKGPQFPSLEAWTTLSGIAATTSKVELFNTCICQGFRYPTVLAKMCVTMQDLSKDRFSLVLGAGSSKRDFDSYGLPWEDHDARIDKSREQIELIKRYWSEPVVDYAGQYYTIMGGLLAPKPSPVISVWWAGNSEASRTLTADHADGWLMGGSTRDEVIEKIADMEERLAERGRPSIQYAVSGQLVIEKTDELARTRLSHLLSGNDAAVERVVARGYVGAPDTVASRIGEKDETGLSYIIFRCAPTLSTLTMFRHEVLPLL